MTENLPTIAKPRAPATARNRVALERSWSNGRPNIADNDTLVPADDCRVVMAEMDAALAGCDAMTATDMAGKILGAYPNARPDNPEAYAESVALAITECPSDLLGKLYLDVIGRPQPFPPVHGEIKAIIGELVERRQRAKSVAKAMLAEHQKRGDRGGLAKKWGQMTEEERRRHDEIMAAWRTRMSAAAESMTGPLRDDGASP